MDVRPEEFAAQVNYLAAMGRMIVPRAFAFAGKSTLFIGHTPFHSEELGSLLPEAVEWHEHAYAPEDFSPRIVVLGRAGYTKDELRTVLTRLAGSPKVVPQEGFVDELLFGHDWWSEEAESLSTMVNQHRGLQIARSVGVLAPVGIGLPKPAAKPPSPKPVLGQTAASKPPQPSGSSRATILSWPTTEAEETRGKGDADYDLRDRSRLKELGYDTKQSAPKRWQILVTKAVPELGLPKVAELIAWFCRSRKQQRGGREKFARAIGEWEHDLARLKKEVYPKHQSKFNWPRSEP